METPYLYLLLNIVVVSVPLIRSFEPRIHFYKKWKYLFPAIGIPGAFFIAWDIIFTDIGVWGFNPKYLTGIELAGLPVEEWLFFITIPYACVFIYEVLNHFWPHAGVFDRIAENLTLFIIAFGAALMVFYYDLLYTFWTFLFLIGFLIFVYYKLKPAWLGKFYRGYTVALIGFFLINGILTGTGIEEEIVWYNAREFIGIRFVSVPFEDLFYGMLLIMINVTLFEHFKSRDHTAKK